MKYTVMFLIAVFPLFAAANSDRPKVEQEQSNEAIAAFVNDTSASAIAPNVNIPCGRAFAFQNKIFGVAVGGAGKDCAEQSLAVLLDRMGQRDKALQILFLQHARVISRHKPQRVCKLPLDEHCPATTYGPSSER